MPKTSDRETNPGRLTTFSKTTRISTILKWLGIIVTLLTLGGFLIGYGMWIGGTNSTISSIKDDVKELEDEDEKVAKNLNTLIEKLTKRLQGFEIILTKQQSSIEALHSEIRLRHADDSYMLRILEESHKSDRVHRLTSRDREKLEVEAQQRAARASDQAIGGASKAIISQEDPLKGLSF